MYFTLNGRGSSVSKKKIKSCINVTISHPIVICIVVSPRLPSPGTCSQPHVRRNARGKERKKIEREKYESVKKTEEEKSINKYVEAHRLHRDRPDQW